MKQEIRLATRLLQQQAGVIHRDQALRLGLGTRFIANRVAEKEWIPVQPGVYRSVVFDQSPRQSLKAACLAGGPRTQASHRSAAWMWDLLPRAPKRPEISVPPSRRPVLAGVIIHRPNDLDPLRTIERRGIPCSDPLRTIFELASVVDTDELTQAVDQALRTRLVDVTGLEAELARRAASGRHGIRAMRQHLVSRGLSGGPDASALELEAIRLFERWRIDIVGTEVSVYDDGRYRIDFMISPTLAVEVDGFAYHWSPEAKRHDEERRNRLRLDGIFVLVYTWRDIRFDERRVAGEILKALRTRAA